MLQCLLLMMAANCHRCNRQIQPLRECPCPWEGEERQPRESRTDTLWRAVVRTAGGARVADDEGYDARPVCRTFDPVPLSQLADPEITEVFDILPRVSLPPLKT